MLLQEYVLAVFLMWVQLVQSGDLLASYYSKVSHSGTPYSRTSVNIGPSHMDEPVDTNVSVVIGVQPYTETTKGSFVVYAESVTEDAANASKEGNLPTSEARMSSGNMNFKTTTRYLTDDTEYYRAQDTEYYRRPVYTVQEGRKPSYDSDHPASSKLGQDSSTTKSEQPESQPPLLTANYSRNGQSSVHKAPVNFQPKEATQDKGSNRNDPEKQAHFLKLPKDSYNGPDSYHTATSASSMSPPLMPLSMYQLETPKENHKMPAFHYQPQKPKDSVILHSDQYQIPSSTEVYESIMLNHQPPDPNEPQEGHLDVYQFQPPKEIYEPQMGAYQYEKMKESTKPPKHTQKPPKPKDFLTPPPDIYQLTESEDSFTAPAKIIQPPKSKDSFKTPMTTYQAKKPEDSLTLPGDMHKHPESEDTFTQYMDAHKPPKPQDILMPPVEMYEHPKLKDSYKPQTERLQPPKQKYVFKGATETYRPFSAKEIHKPLVLSPEEFYKPPMQSQTPSKDNKMPSLSEPLEVLTQPSPLTHANNDDTPYSSHSTDMDDNIYFDYDPSSYVQKENSNGHAHNYSHEYDHSEQLNASEPNHSHGYDHLAGQLHAPEHDHSHIYDSQDYPDIYFLTPPPPPPNHSNGTPPPPPKELNGVMQQPPKDMVENSPSPAKETNGILSLPPRQPQEAPPYPPKNPYGAPPPLPIEPYGAPMYPPKQTYAAHLLPPMYGYGVHSFEHPYGVHPTPPTTTPPPPPKRKRFGYYHIGRKLYLIPAVFTFLFIPYVLALIIKSIIRHKVNVPFGYWQTGRKNDWDENEMERRVARALEAVENRYK